jgi:hypothetical protein
MNVSRANSRPILSLRPLWGETDEPTPPAHEASPDAIPQDAFQPHWVGHGHEAMLLSPGFEVDPREVEEIMASPNAVPREMVEFVLKHRRGVQHKAWHDGTSPWERGPKRKVLERDGMGRSFLAMHHHMIEEMQTHFPGAAQFEGWSKEEIDAAVETGVLEGVQLTEGFRKSLSRLNNIQEHLDAFPDSEALGKFLLINAYMNGGQGGLHELMHLEMADENDPVQMMNFERNLLHKSFWKLHGFLDRVWLEFLEAKGTPLPREAIDYQMEMMELLTDPTDDSGFEKYLGVPVERPTW